MSYAETNIVLRELLDCVQAVLGNHFIGMYLFGSLTSGDFDQDSDIDVLVVTDDEISGDMFSALQTMHARIALIDSVWASSWKCLTFDSHCFFSFESANLMLCDFDETAGPLVD